MNNESFIQKEFDSQFQSVGGLNTTPSDFSPTLKKFSVQFTWSKRLAPKTFKPDIKFRIDKA